MLPTYAYVAFLFSRGMTVLSMIFILSSEFLFYTCFTSAQALIRRTQHPAMTRNVTFSCKRAENVALLALRERAAGCACMHRNARPRVKVVQCSGRVTIYAMLACESWGSLADKLSGCGLWHSSGRVRLHRLCSLPCSR